MLHKRLRKIDAAGNAYAREIESPASLHLVGIIATREATHHRRRKICPLPPTPQSNTRFIFTGVC